MNRPIKFRASPILPEFYEVSDTGIVLNEHGKPLKQRKDKDGYPEVILVRKPERYVRRVHGLVAVGWNRARQETKEAFRNFKQGV